VILSLVVWFCIVVTGSIKITVNTPTIKITHSVITHSIAHVNLHASHFPNYSLYSVNIGEISLQDSGNLWRHKSWSNKFIASKNGAILWRHNMVPFNGAILWHVCTRHKVGVRIIFDSVLYSKFYGTLVAHQVQARLHHQASLLLSLEYKTRLIKSGGF